MTKAERIYNATRFECKRHIESWGYDIVTDGGFNGLNTEETTSTRTTNEIEKILRSAERGLKINNKLNIGTEEKRELENKTLTMIRRTLENQIKNNNKKF